MAKTTNCPFTHSLCTDCALYRGRHYYFNSCKRYRDPTNESSKGLKSGDLRRPTDFQDLKKLVEPWDRTGDPKKDETRIRLKLVDRESGRVRVCDLSEAKAWDWSNPAVMRVIDDWQVTSMDSLIKILRYKAEKGFEEVEVREAPRFMILAGG